MPHQHINGIQIYYELHGKGEPLILIPGFTNHHEMWGDFLSSLSKKFQVLIFDTRGSGESEAPPPPYTIDLLADDTIALMDQLQIDRSHMIGCSMGTTILQSIALRYPKRVNKGIMISPFNSLPKTSIMILKAIEKLFLAKVDPALAFKCMLPWLFSNEYLDHPNQVENIITDILRDPYPLSLEGYAGQLAAMAHFDQTENLHKIDADILLLAGEQDLLTPLYLAQTLETKLKNAKLYSFENVGHMLRVERKNEVLNHILKFLT